MAINNLLLPHFFKYFLITVLLFLFSGFLLGNSFFNDFNQIIKKEILSKDNILSDTYTTFDTSEDLSFKNNNWYLESGKQKVVEASKNDSDNSAITTFWDNQIDWYDSWWEEKGIFSNTKNTKPLRFMAIDATLPYTEDLGESITGNLSCSSLSTKSFFDSIFESFEFQLINSAEAYANVAAMTDSRVSISVPILDMWTSANSSSEFTADQVVSTISFTDRVSGGLTANLACSAGATEITGTVFEDFDYDGICDAIETTGIENITVTVTDSLGNAFSDITDNTGAYTITGLIAGRTYRVDFTNIPSWAKSTFSNNDNGTTVQFIKPDNCANLGLSSPSFFCESNPTIALSCYQTGTGADNPTDPGFISFPWTNSGNVNDGAPAPIYGVPFVDIGTVWGQAYQRDAEQIFVSTILRRHSAIGPTGLGGIYQLDNTGALVGSFDLHGVVPANGGIALDFGSITRSVVSGGISSGTAGDNQISDDPTEATRDLDAFAKVGIVGYGDIDFEEDGKTLWVTNLNSRELIRVETQNSSNPLPTDGSQAATAVVNRYDITTLSGLPTCTGGLFRPWALAFYQGRGYLGGICSGETLQNIIDVEAYVLSFDPDNVAAGFTTELNFPMDYTRESPASFRNPDLNGTWGLGQVQMQK